MSNTNKKLTASSRDNWFTTTHWSVVAAAVGEDSPEARQALDALCRTYREPLYGFICRQGHSQHDAEDLLQAFFLHVLEKKLIARADRRRGKFRNFILVALRSFLTDRWRWQRIRRRGGGAVHVPIGLSNAEEGEEIEPADEMTPDRAFDLQWAKTILEQALDLLKREVQNGNTPWHGELLPFVDAQQGSKYFDVAVKHSVSESAVKTAVGRLRRRRAEIIRQMIASTVCTSQEVDEEIRYLLVLLHS